MLECPKTARMKDFLKLFKTVMDFKGLSIIVTKQKAASGNLPLLHTNLA